MAMKKEIVPESTGSEKYDRRKIIVYYTNWSQYRKDPYKYIPENIIPIAAHIDKLHYAFAKIDMDGNIFPTDPSDCGLGLWSQCQGNKVNETMYHKIIEIKKYNPSMKIIISIGGYQWGDINPCPYFSMVASLEEKRSNFVEQAIKFCRTFGFDGIDIDWESPGLTSRGCNSNDAKNLALLVEELYTGFKNESIMTRKPRLSLSIVLPAILENLKNIEPEAFHQYTDYLLLMAYDYHGPWDNVKYFNTPMHRQNSNDTLSITTSVEKLLEKIPPWKLYLGIATYGHSFTVSGSCEPLTKSSPGAAQPYTETEGILSYYEVETILKNEATRVFWDNKTESTYACNMDQNIWISYDDEKSLKSKIDYLILNNLAGAMFWSLDLDDFLNDYPLVRFVAGQLNP
jgi:chitinase